MGSAGQHGGCLWKATVMSKGHSFCKSSYSMSNITQSKGHKINGILLLNCLPGRKINTIYIQ